MAASRAAASFRRLTSFPSPRIPASSCRLASGCCGGPATMPPGGRRMSRSRSISRRCSSKSGRAGEVVANVLAASGIPASAAGTRDHRAGAAPEQRETLAALRQLRNAGRADRHGRFRNRIFLAQLSAEAFRSTRSRSTALSFRIWRGRAEASTITRAITSLGNGLGIATTAEGVETAAQLAELRLEGCTEVQGYLFSPPRPGCEVPRLLAQFNNVVFQEEVIA